MIKFLDLKAINQRYESELKKAFNSFLDTGHYILGEQVSKFENDFADYCGTKYCVGVSNGLDAITLILEAYKILGYIKEGDEVVVPANTYIATILAIRNAGLIPVLIEPELDTFNINPNEIIRKISSKTKVIIAVHLYGQLCNMKAIHQIAKKYGLFIIEDAAQAHGAIDDDGIKAGNLGDIAAFSFYPTKNLGALGDAGGITTNNHVLADVILKLRNYGRVSTNENELKGFNCRLDEIQAAFLSIKLRDLDNLNIKKRNIANSYLTGIKNDKVKLPYYNGSQNHIFHQFVILVKNRGRFMNYMRKNKVELSIHYPIAPHKQKAFLDLEYLNLPITEYIHNSCVSLPINNALTDNNINVILNLINSYE